MRRGSVLVQAIGVVLLLTLALAEPVTAAGPRYALDLPLVPLEAPGFVELTSYVLVTTLSCDVSACALLTEQVFRLHNRDRVQEAALRVGLPLGPPEEGQGSAEMLPISDAVLREDQGEDLDPSGSDSRYRAIWDIHLGRNETKTFAVSTTHALPQGHFVHWRGELALLAAWGTIEGVHVEVDSPTQLTDDALLVAQPGSFALQGKALVWEYENPQALVRHELVVISPHSWLRLRELQSVAAHHELARLHADMQAEATADGVPFPDRFAEISAELRAALQGDPGNVEARLELAQLYRARADAAPALRLNYMLLAAEQWAAALQQRPGDAQIRQSLNQAYEEAATLASQLGDSLSALTYLAKAEDVAGENKEILALRWALKLAEQGISGRSWAQIEGLLSPQARAVLLYHAPPLVSVRTEVTLTSSTRQVLYRFRPYAPSASVTWDHLRAVVQRLQELHGCQAELHTAADSATLSVRVAYASMNALQQTSGAIAAAALLDDDLLSAIVAIPWQTQIDAYAVERGLAENRYVYRELVDLQSVQVAWTKEKEYASWRLAELRSSKPTDERGQLGQQLALLALAEQRSVWERLPVGSFWIFRAALPGSSEPSPDWQWLLGWNQARTLEAARSHLDIPPLRRLAPLLLIPLSVCALGLALGRRRGRRGPLR